MTPPANPTAMQHDFPTNALPGGASPANLEAFARAGGVIRIGDD